MKQFTAPLLWFSGIVVLYVLASGPAILIERGLAGRIIDVVYTPLTYLASYTPAYKVLLPYWQFWMDKAGTDICPFLFG